MNKGQILDTMLSVGLTPDMPLSESITCLDRQIGGIERQLAGLREARDFLAAHKPAVVRLRPEHAVISKPLSCSARLLAYLEQWAEREQPLVHSLPHTYTHIEDLLQ